MADPPFLPFDDEPERRARAAPAPRVGEDARLIEELARVCARASARGEGPRRAVAAVGHSWSSGSPARATRGCTCASRPSARSPSALVGADLAREGLRLLSRAQALALVEQACAETLDASSYFGPLRDRPGFHRALQGTLDELRAAGISSRSAPAAAFADPRKPRELQRVLARYDAAPRRGPLRRRGRGPARARRRSRRSRLDGALYLLPGRARSSPPSSARFLERIAGGRLAELATDPPEAWTAPGAARAALPRDRRGERAARGVPADPPGRDSVRPGRDPAHGRLAVYPRSAWELSREHGIPCTFSGGVAATFTPARPGRARLSRAGSAVASQPTCSARRSPRAR